MTAARQAIAVAAYVTRVASGDDVEGDLAGFSSRGPTIDGRPGIDIAAPGSVIRSACSSQTWVPCAGEWTEMSGTSMAAAVVSGTAALILQERPRMNPDEAKVTLQATSSMLKGEGLVVAGADRKSTRLNSSHT